MAGLVPAIHVYIDAFKTWMPGTGPGMTISKHWTVSRIQSTKITLTSLTLVSVGPVWSRSPVAVKKAVASLLSR